MKKYYLSIVLIIITMVSITTPTNAVNGFTLTNPIVKHADQYDDSFKKFWGSVQMEFMDDGSGNLSANYENGAIVSVQNNTYTTTGQINGNFDPTTGILSGEYSITNLNVFHKETAGGITHYETLVVMSGKYEEQLHTGDNVVSISFAGENTQTVTGNYPASWTANGEVLDFTMNWEINVDFTIEGKVEVADEVFPLDEKLFEDSGARFSDLSGQVEILVPCGFKPDGDYDYCDETWEWARLDTVLPEGTMIRTQERSSSMLSFADMTTFVQKPDTIIVLSKPAEGESQFKLLVGNLWVNVKKMLKDGSMDIEMSQAVCGIKGTIFVLEDDGSTSTLKVIEGTVDFTALADGKSQRIEAGTMISADSSGLGAAQPFDIAAESAAWPQVADAPASATAVTGGDQPEVIVLPYGEEVATPAPVTTPGLGSKIGKLMIIYAIAAVFVVSVVVVITLIAHRRKRD